MKKRTALMLIVFVALAIAFSMAGAPPPETIPWRACPVVDTVESMVFIDTVWYITREDYMSDVLGMKPIVEAENTARMLRKIEALLQARRKAGD